MCGIVGLFSKSSGISDRLGAYVADMLIEMRSRGPDSAGIAIYGDGEVSGTTKLSLYSAAGDTDWSEVRKRIAEAIGVERAEVGGPHHALFVVYGDAEDAEAWARQELEGIHVMSAGRSIEIYKAAVSPVDFVARFELRKMSGSHAIGHTRMATESRVTTEGSHPFTTGLDLCLVHNGSLSNHNSLRRELRRNGITFRTENDSEVAAGYLAWRLREGASLEEALESCLTELDGFYTFAVGTADGFAVLRDPIACKPAVMAETDEWVAMASEHRAIAVLPGAESATVWEPEPGRVYSWGKELAG